MQLFLYLVENSYLEGNAYYSAVIGWEALIGKCHDCTSVNLKTDTLIEGQRNSTFVSRLAG